MHYTAIALMLGAPAYAQDLTYSDATTTICLEDAESYGAKSECVGASSNACMTDTPGGETTVGMGGCLDQELKFWDARLNTVYTQLRDEEQDIDPARAEALLAMQRAWLTYRDARCDYARSQWGGGTGQGPATLQCLMQATAEQVFVLERSFW